MLYTELEERREGRKLKRLGKSPERGDSVNPNRVWPYERPSSFRTPNFSPIAWIALRSRLDCRHFYNLVKYGPPLRSPSGFYTRNYASGNLTATTDDRQSYSEIIWGPSVIGEAPGSVLPACSS